MPIWHITEPLTVKVAGVDNVALPEEEGKKKKKGKGKKAAKGDASEVWGERGKLFIKCGLYHGGPKGVIKETDSKVVPAPSPGEAVPLDDTINLGVIVKTLPRATVLSLTLMHRAQPGGPGYFLVILEGE